ncbi:large subunit of alpha-aminoadipate reductase [Irineochytrium annulatum]|nr:large subunit of alpha-aminoadipate reductase [Irineochytrium annulatum]
MKRKMDDEADDSLPAPASIPGYFYDPSKKRYFKIIADNKASNSQMYSKSTVKTRIEPREPKPSELVAPTTSAMKLLIVRERGIAVNFSRSIMDGRFASLTKADIPLEEGPGFISALAVHPTCNTLYIGDGNKMRVATLLHEPGKPLTLRNETFRAQKSDLTSLSVAVQLGRTLIAATTLGFQRTPGAITVYAARPQMSVWGLDGLYTFSAPKSSVWAGAMTVDKGGVIRLALSASKGRFYMISGLGLGVQSMRVRAGSEVYSQAWSGDGGVLYNGLRDGTVEGYDVRRGERPSICLPAVSSALCHVSAPWDTSRVVTASLDGKMCVWDLRSTGKPILVLTHPNTDTRSRILNFIIQISRGYPFIYQPVPMTPPAASQSDPSRTMPSVVVNPALESLKALAPSGAPASPTIDYSHRDLDSRIASCRSRLSNLTDINLPTDYPRPVPAKTVEAEHRRSISDRTARAIMRVALAASEGAGGEAGAGEEDPSPFNIVLAAFAVLLHKYTGEEDVCVGSSSLSTNPLVLRMGVADADTFPVVLSNVVAAERDAANDEVPFAVLLEALFPGTSSPTNGKTNGTNGTSQQPQEEIVNPTLFKVRFFNLTDTTAETLASTAMTSSSSACDITILISQSSTLRRILPIDIAVLYNSVIFSASRIVDMLDQLESVLDHAARNPTLSIGSIPLITDSSRPRLPDPTASLAWDGFEGAITDIFARNARAHPDRVCVVETGCNGSAGRTFSYQAINEASNVLAHYLVKGGVQREDVVVLYSYRGVDLVVAVMGVLKAGATFSVIDPAYPSNRQVVYLSVAKPRGLVVLRKAGELQQEVISYIEKELSIQCQVPSLAILDDGSLSGGVNGDGGDIFDDVRTLKSEGTGIELGPDSIGTLSFTSGSTGIPKGVRGRHFSLTHFYPWMKEEFAMSAEERFTMLSGIAHDPIQRDIFTPLFLGAQLRIPSSDDIGNPGQLASWMATNGITVTHLTPAMGQLLSANASTPIPTLRNAFFVGDVLTKRDVTRLQFLAPNVHIINMYGTTETQRAVSYLTIPPSSVNLGFLSEQKDIMPAGKGMKDVQLLVVNPAGLLCGVGEVGEIYVRSSGLAEGYLRLEDVTREKFITNPFNPSGPPETERGKALPHFKGARDRMYRTGDLGRYRPDGSVECTGRADDQVKIRGFRIELGEIDTHLSQHPRVRENVTLVRRDKFEEPTLVSYFVPLEGAEHSDLAALIKDIREYLRLKLPSYAVPSVFAPLTRMPLTPNGKVDKNALPFPDTAIANLSASAASTTQITPTQSTILSIWAELLHRPAANISLDDNFFDLGGHSILATRLLFGVRKQLAVEVPLGLIYREPTIGGMSREVERLRGSDLNISNAPRSKPSIAAVTQQQSADELGGEDVVDYAADLDVVDDANVSAAGRPAFTFPRAEGGTFFLTGATGFLGAFILRSLLARGAQKVLCLVRASNEAAALDRLRGNGRRHLCWEDAWVADGRVGVVVGDLSGERFGIKEDAWRTLCEEVDVIVHNGALVHWVYPYHKLRAANVLGTLWGLRMATEGRLKPFHFVSSTSVLDTRHYVRKFLDVGKAVPESDDLEGARRGLRSGYGQSKWVAEGLVMRARSRGVPATIIRPGYIVGDSTSGVSNTDDFLWRLVKGCIQLGKVPRISNVVNMCPVDYVADSVADIATKETGLSHPVYQMWNPHRFRFDDLFDLIAPHGYPVVKTDYIHWRTSLMDLTLSASNPTDAHALYPLLHFVLDDLPTSTRSPELDDSNVRAVVEGRCQDVRELIGLYLGYFTAIGFLDAPQQADVKMERRAEWEELAKIGIVSRTGA